MIALKRILLPTDFSEYSAAARTYACAFAISSMRNCICFMSFRTWPPWRRSPASCCRRPQIT